KDALINRSSTPEASAANLRADPSERRPAGTRAPRCRADRRQTRRRLEPVPRRARAAARRPARAARSEARDRPPAPRRPARAGCAAPELRGGRAPPRRRRAARARPRRPRRRAPLLHRSATTPPCGARRRRARAPRAAARAAARRARGPRPRAAAASACRTARNTARPRAAAARRRAPPPARARCFAISCRPPPACSNDSPDRARGTECRQREPLTRVREIALGRQPRRVPPPEIPVGLVGLEHELQVRERPPETRLDLLRRRILQHCERLGRRADGSLVAEP